jgi:methionyl-tRNA formyltransferase
MTVPVMQREPKQRQKSYIVAGCKPWNRRLFEEEIRKLPGRWHYVDRREQLQLQTLKKISPRYIFFLHWSWKVPEELVDNFECVCFHMTDVPFGRGGSPLQNLIAQGHRETILSALRMSEDLDAGPVYMKEPLCLTGGAEEIYSRAGRLSAKMIEHMIQHEPKPAPQRGTPVVFKRRKPEESEVRSAGSLEYLYDFIRMLDAEGYPRAFLNHSGFRYEFSRATLYDGRIVADVTITRANLDRENRK